MTKEDRLYAALLCKFSKGVGNIKGAKILADPEALGRLSKANPQIRTRIKKEIESIQKHQVSTITLLDPDYPRALRNIHNAPLILYYYGALPKGFCMAVVGTRRPSKYGMTTAQLIISQLAEFRIPIVSGFAYGIDTIAHQAALENEIPTVAVLGTGMDVQYPIANTWMRRRIVQTGGCILSEFPFGTKAHPSNFPTRNRIISGLSNGILVVEAANRSGSLITAELGLEQGKNIFTIPGTVFGESFKGNHKLARLGAVLVENGYQILSEYPEFQTLVEGKEAHSNPTYKDMRISHSEKSSVSKNQPKESPSLKINAYVDWEKEELADGERKLKIQNLEKQLKELDEISTIVYHSVEKPRTLEEIMSVTGLEEPGKILSSLTQLILKGLVEEKGGLYYFSD